MLITGGITVIAPDSSSVVRYSRPRVLRRLTTNICFGGPDLTTAYITLGHTGRVVPAPGRYPASAGLQRMSRDGRHRAPRLRRCRRGGGWPGPFRGRRTERPPRVRGRRARPRRPSLGRPPRPRPSPPPGAGRRRRAAALPPATRPAWSPWPGPGTLARRRLPRVVFDYLDGAAETEGDPGPTAGHARGRLPAQHGRDRRGARPRPHHHRARAPGVHADPPRPGRLHPDDGPPATWPGPGRPGRPAPCSPSRRCRATPSRRWRRRPPGRCGSSCTSWAAGRGRPSWWSGRRRPATSALVVTMDTQIPGNRERDLRHGVRRRCAWTPRMVANFAPQVALRPTGASTPPGTGSSLDHHQRHQPRAARAAHDRGRGADGVDRRPAPLGGLRVAARGTGRARHRQGHRDRRRRPAGGRRRVRGHHRVQPRRPSARRDAGLAAGAGRGARRRGRPGRGAGGRRHPPGFGRRAGASASGPGPC